MPSEARTLERHSLSPEPKDGASGVRSPLLSHHRLFIMQIHTRCFADSSITDAFQRTLSTPAPATR